MKRSIFGRAGASLASLMLLIPVLAACGPTATPVPPTATTGSAAEVPTATTGVTEQPTATEAAADATPTGGAMGEKLKVGLVTDVGRLNDKSFNQTSWEGVQRAERELGVEAKALETVDTKDYESNINQFIDEDYDVIVTVGFALGEATIAAAKANPDVLFIGVDQFQEETIDNLAGIVFEEDISGFLAGALAASISKTNNIGAVLGTDDVPPVWRFGEGYKAGAAHVNPATTVQVTYHSDVDITRTFTDPEWGKTTALSMIDRGADVLFGAGGATGNGAIYAASERNLPAIGVDTDQYFTIGDQYAPSLVTSAMKLLDVSVFNVIKSAQEGTLEPGNFVGEVGLAPFHDWEDKVPAEVKTMLEDLDEDLKNGTVKTCVSPAKGVPSPCGDTGTTGNTTPTP